MPLPMQLLQSVVPAMPGGSELRAPPAADLPEVAVGPQTPDPASVPRPPAFGVDGGIQAARESKKLEIATAGTKDLDRFLANVDQAKNQIEGKLGAVIQQRAAATGDVAAAVQGAADVQAAVAQRAAELKQQKLQQDIAWRQKILQQQDKAQREAEKEFGTILENMRAASRKQIDPNRFWHSRDIGQKVAITIGMILHDIGAGISGSNRRGIDILNGLIERDIEAQRQDIEAARREVEIEKFGYTTKQDFAAKRALHEDAHRIVALEMIDQQIDINAAMSNDEIIKQQALATKAELQVKQAEFAERAVSTSAAYKLQALQITGGALEGRARLALSAVSGSGGGRVPPAIIEKAEKAQALQRIADEVETNYRNWTSFGGSGVVQFSSEIGIESGPADWRRYHDNVGVFLTNILSGLQMPEAQIKRITGLIPNAGDTNATAFAKIKALRVELTGRAIDIETALKWGGYNPPEYEPGVGANDVEY